MSGYSVVHVDDIPEQDDGQVPMRAVRHHFGIAGFGVNAWTARNTGDRLIPEHQEANETEEESDRDSGARRGRCLTPLRSAAAVGLVDSASVAVETRLGREATKGAGMAQTRKRFESPDETRRFADNTGQVDIVNVGELQIGRGVFEPGWRWSTHVKPLAGTDSCQAVHTGYVVEGRMAVRMDDGDEVEYGPGDAFHMPAGHDAWIVGDERCVLIDVTGMSNYAKPS